MDPYRLRVERAWKRAAEEQRYLCFQEQQRRIQAEDFERVKDLAVPFMAAYEEILESSDEFRGARGAMDVPPIVRKILDERDDATDEAVAYVHRSLGLENQLHGVMAELQELRAQNQVLRVDNARLRNAREGLPLDASMPGPVVAGWY